MKLRIQEGLQSDSLGCLKENIRNSNGQWFTLMKIEELGAHCEPFSSGYRKAVFQVFRGLKPSKSKTNETEHFLT